MRDKAFRCGDPWASRSNDLGHLRNGLRAIGHGGNALRAAGLEHLGHTRHARRHQGRVIDFSVGARRRNDDDLLHARHLGRDRGHQATEGNAPLPRGM